MEKEIVLSALFNKATSLIDGGWRVSFDLTNQDAQNIALLAQLRDRLLHVVVMTEEQLKAHAKVAKK